MSKWLSVVVLVMLILVGAMGLRGIVMSRSQAPVLLAVAGGPVPPSPWHVAGGPVPPSPWRVAGGPVPPSPWSK